MDPLDEWRVRRWKADGGADAEALVEVVEKRDAGRLGSLNVCSVRADRPVRPDRIDELPN